MSRTNINTKTLYLNKVFGCSDKYLEALQQLAKDENMHRMQVSPHEARILQFLVKITKAKKVIEIGTFYAYSTLHIARALSKNGQVWTLDNSFQRHKKSKRILKDLEEFKKINWLRGDALESLKTIEKFAPFDMIFMDADKGEYLDYLKWGEKNLKKGGLLVADNTLLFGAVYGLSNRVAQKEVIQKVKQLETRDRSWIANTFSRETVKKIKTFNKRLSNTSFWSGALIPTNEGLTVSIKQ